MATAAILNDVQPKGFFTRQLSDADPAVADANALLQPAEARGGQESFRYVAPAALVLIVVFGTMYLNDRRRGGYRAERLQRARP